MECTVTSSNNLKAIKISPLNHKIRQSFVGSAVQQDSANQPPELENNIQLKVLLRHSLHLLSPRVALILRPFFIGAGIHALFLSPFPRVRAFRHRRHACFVCTVAMRRSNISRCLATLHVRRLECESLFLLLVYVCTVPT